MYLLGEPNKVTSFLKHTKLDGVDFEDNNPSVLEYDKALARIFISSVEVNGYGRRQFVISGSKGTMEVKPIENPCQMWKSSTDIAKECYADIKEEVPINMDATNCRYDQMMQDFYAYIVGEKQNPFSYEHDYLVQKVLDKVVGGVGFRSKISIVE